MNLEPGRVDVPDHIREWIEGVAGGDVVHASRQAGGGSNEAWFVDIARPDGATDEIFLRWNRADPDVSGNPWTMHREAEIYRALSETAVPVARFLAVHPTEQAMLVTRLRGENWFSRLTDPAEQVSVAKDFITHLAALHSLDPEQLAIPGLDASDPVPVHVRLQLDEIEAIIATRGGEPDPVLRLALDWLSDNIPDYAGPVVLVQGDTGPGNFMYADGRVVAVVDWELAHLGDPMDDIAWVSLRAVQEPFTDLDARFAEYEDLSRHRLDLDRIRYYRVLAGAKIMVMSHGIRADARAAAGSDPGAGLIFGQLHRRLCAEALADVMRIELEPVDVPDESPVGDPLYDVVLDQLRHVVTPRIEDGFAVQRIKGLARVLKYLAAANRYGPAMRAAEISELAALLGERPTDVASGRSAVAEAASAGRISRERALQALYAGVQRDNELCRAASGALADRHYDPLVSLGGAAR